MDEAKARTIRTIGELRKRLADFPDESQVSVEAADGLFRFVTIVTESGQGRSVIMRTTPAADI